MAFFKKFTFLILLLSSAASASNLKEDFMKAYDALKSPPRVRIGPLGQTILPIQRVRNLCSMSRIRAKILRVVEEETEIYQNNLYFSLPSAICLQSITVEQKHDSVHTLCIREDYVLMNFTFDFPKESF